MTTIRDHRPRQPVRHVGRAWPTSDFASDNRQRRDLRATRPDDYIDRLSGGDMGSLPAILGLVVLFVVFSSLQRPVPHPLNMANLVVQAGPIFLLAMGLVFVLLLGEIDLSAGVAGGVSATSPPWRSSTTARTGASPCWPGSPSAP